MNDVVPIVAQLTIATLLKAQGAGSTVRLFKGNTIPNLNSVVADFEEADYPGYVRQTVTTVPLPYLDPTNSGVSITLPSHQFDYSGSGPVLENVIYGYLWVDADANLLQAGNLPNPVSMATEGDSIPLMITWNSPGGS